MIRALLLFLVVLLAPLHAVPWRDDALGCSVNLPDSAGWQQIPSSNIPGLQVLVSLQHPGRGAVFGITSLSNPPSTSLRDPATQQSIETMLRGFGYTWLGSSTTVIGGLEWRQYNVKAQDTSGVVRYATANNRIFAVTLLVGAGREAAQDEELQASASSVRFYPPVAAAIAASTNPGAGYTEQEPNKIAADPLSLIIFIGVGALALILVLVLLFKGEKKA